MRRLGRALSVIASPLGHRVRWKIIGPYAALSLIVAFMGTFIITNLVTASLSDRFTNQLVEAGRAAQDSVVRQERRHLEVLRTVAFTEGVASEIANEDGSQVGEIIEPIAANSGTERIEVLNLAGQRVAGRHLEDLGTLTYEVPEETPDRSAWTSVQAVLRDEPDARGDKFAEIVTTEAGPAFYTAGPIRLDGEVVGVVLVGTLLGTFLPVAQSEILANLTFYDDDLAILSTTFTAEEEDTFLVVTGAEDISSGVRQHHSIAGREYEVLYGELMLRGDPLGWYSVGLPTSFITNANGATRVQLSLLFSGLVALVLVVGILLSRGLTAPLFRLVGTATAFGNGDLTARSDIDGRDEIGSLAKSFNTMAERLQRQHLATIATLVSAIDARDPYTRGHSVRVGHLAVDLGTELGLTGEQVQHLQIGGYLHDIGKIGIRDAILLKPSDLTPEERAAVEEHPRIGTEILAAIDLPAEVMAVVGQHHEKMDGSGYPFHMSKEELTIFPRVAAVADMYDALRTDRPYRPAFEPKEILKLLQREANEGLLDPEVVATMVRLASRWEMRFRDDPLLQNAFGMKSPPPPDVPRTPKRRRSLPRPTDDGDEEKRSA